MNLGGLVSSFRVAGGIEVTRRAAGTRANGLYTLGASESLTIDPAVVYPAGPREIRLLPEGQRSSEALVFVTVEPLQGAAEPNGASPDIVSYGGIDYEIRAVTQWYGAGGYYLSVGVKAPVT